MEKHDLLSPPRDDRLKLLAVCTMLLDHIGFVFEGMLPFALVGVLRSVGRLPFPIFAYFAAVGATHTSCRKRYLLRLLAAAAVSQWPFYLMAGGVNVMVTLAAGVLSVWGYESLHRRLSFGAWAAPVVLGALCQLAGADYGIYGVFTVFFFYVFSTSPAALAAAQSSLTVTVLCIPPLGIGNIQLLSLLACPLISAFARTPQRERPLRLPRLFFYGFYPVHLLLLEVVFCLVCK